MSRQFIQSLKQGQKVDEVFLLSKILPGKTRNNDSYFSLVLADKTGEIPAKLWNAEMMPQQADAGDYVRVEAEVQEYRGALQAVIRSLAMVAAEAVDPADFIPSTSHDVEKMFQQILKLTASMQNPHLKALVNAFWKDETIAARFKRAPAAKRMHHAYLGGLLEHTLSMALLADRIVAHYAGTRLDRDLILAGVFLHDMGKIYEFDYDRNIEYSDQGRLLSHIVIGIGMIQEKVNRLKNFPPDLAMLIQHMVVSHHGDRNFGSPEPPKTMEAVLLNYVDELDSKIRGIHDFMSADETKGSWTAYHGIHGRHFFKGQKEPQIRADPGPEKEADDGLPRQKSLL